MLPSELKLTSLGHCYVHLPETFVSEDSAVKGGAIVSVKSIQTDTEIFVIWNGQLTSGEHVELDFTFGQANNLRDELVIISLVTNSVVSDCSSCRMELLDSSDFTILSQHTETNLLDTCKLVYVGLVVPIFLSQNVKVLVKVDNVEPSDKAQVILNKWTEMSFVHDLTDLPKNNDSKDQQQSFNRGNGISLPHISYVLEIGHSKPIFNFCSILICGTRGSGKTHSLKQTLRENENCHCEYFNCKQLRGKRPENVKKIFVELADRARADSECQASIIALDDIDSFLDSDSKHEEEHGQEILYKKRLVAIFCLFLKQFERDDLNDASSKKILVIATCRSLDMLDRRISKASGRSFFAEILTINTPDVNERTKILKCLIAEYQQINCKLNDAELEDIAQKTSSFMPSDIRRVYERALINACSRSSLEFNSDMVSIQMSDFLSSLENYVPINLRNVSLQSKSDLRTFDQIGGMPRIKDTLTRTILLPLRYPKLYKKSPLKSQNSLLLYGPPGCGKTLIAEALSHHAGLNSICVRGPELLSKYIGASEASVRNLFKRAQLARPCVIFFDEFESLVAKRGSDSTGVTDRVVNQFLTILDGVECLGQDIFIIAATSRPDMIDPAMLRPGRLDKHIYCPLPSDQDRLDILRVLSRSIEIEGVDLNKWAQKSVKFTGADIQSLLCSAQLKSLNELIETENSSPIQRKDIPNKQLKIVVRRHHLEEAYNEMKNDIELNYERLLRDYPPTIKKLSRQQVAVRSTLA